ISGVRARPGALAWAGPLVTEAAVSARTDATPMISIRRPVVKRQRVDNAIVLLIPCESADESKPIYPTNGHLASRLIWRRASAKSAALRHGEPVHVGGPASTSPFAAFRRREHSQEPHVRGANVLRGMRRRPAARGGVGEPAAVLLQRVPPARVPPPTACPRRPPAAPAHRPVRRPPPGTRRPAGVAAPDPAAH